MTCWLGSEVTIFIIWLIISTIEILKERITKRGNINEQYLTLDYLERLNDAYSRFFLDYKDAPLLIINAADINLESNEKDYETPVSYTHLRAHETPEHRGWRGGG